MAKGDEDQYWRGVAGAMEAVEAGVEDGQFYGEGGAIKTAGDTTKAGACADDKNPPRRKGDRQGKAHGS